MARGVNLPENFQRVADTFDGLDSGRKNQILAHLQGAKDSTELNKIADQIIKNGGAEGELVARIFSKANPGENTGGERSATDNKRVSPSQKKEGGTGAVHSGHEAEDSPHTSSALPPVHGHRKDPPVESDKNKTDDPSGKQPGGGFGGGVR
jgi:hypothetical protein